MKDPTEWRNKFDAWKNGTPTSELFNLPKYDTGSDDYFEENGHTYHYVKEGNKIIKRKVVFKSQNGDVFGTKQEALDNNPTPFKKALFNRIDPTQDYPTAFQAARHWTQAKIKALSGEENEKEWELSPTIGNRTSEAAWAKRLGLPYDRSLLPVWNGDTVRLSKQLEQEIPVDTTMLKDRIAGIEKLMDYSSKYRRSNVINAAYEADKQALEALRKTYATGQPVGVNEFSYNSRQLVDNGMIDEWNISPLNVLKEYNIRYDKDQNKMYYSDEYDFNEFDWAVPGNPYRIRGAIDLPKHDKGKSIHIKPANRGKFTATMKRTGKSAEQLKHSKNPLTRKRAIFALNARKWKH